MQIPGGDLAPARRRRYGGGYGRRRRRRHRRVAVLLLIAAAAGVAAYWYYPRGADHPVVRQSHKTCPTPSPTPTQVALPQPSQVRLVLLNGTSRNGLAKAVKRQLEARGFVVTDAATAPAALPGPSRIAYGPGALPGATLLAQQITGTQVVSDPSKPAGSIELTLGSDFQQLAAPVRPTALPSATASPCASIQP